MGAFWLLHITEPFIPLTEHLPDWHSKANIHLKAVQSIKTTAHVLTLSQMTIHFQVSFSHNSFIGFSIFGSCPPTDALCHPAFFSVCFPSTCHKADSPLSGKAWPPAASEAPMTAADSGYQGLATGNRTESSWQLVGLVMDTVMPASVCTFPQLSWFWTEIRTPHSVQVLLSGCSTPMHPREISSAACEQFWRKVFFKKQTWKPFLVLILFLFYMVSCISIALFQDHRS